MVGQNRLAAKSWCFTLNNPQISESDLSDELLAAGADFLVFQLEVGEQGTPHFQGFAHFPTRVRMTVLRAALPTAHFEIAKGTIQQNIEYCTKPEGRIGEFCQVGVPPTNTQGHRSDLDSLHSAIKEGLTSRDYYEQFFSLACRYPNALENYKRAQIPPRDSSVPHECIVIYGPPGTGKSRLAQHIGGDGYRHDNGKWFDGYGGERTLILDDFRGASLSFSSFKRVVDRYPVRVEIKGSTCQLATTKTIITTNYLPEDWWDKEVTGASTEAIFRRISSVIWVPLPYVYYQFASYASFQRSFTPQLVIGHDGYPQTPLEATLLASPFENE